MVYLNAQYDTSTQAVDENTKKIIVTVTSAEKLNENTYISQEDVSYNRSVLSTSELGANYSPALYSKNWLIFPIAFYIEKLEMASALKHSFI